MLKRLLIGVAAVAILVLILAGVAVSQLPAYGAGALLFPSRRVNVHQAPDGCVERTFATAGISLSGWVCATTAPRKGTIVYLHGVADNRGSAAGAIERLVPLGYDVIAYDSRAHGTSGGDRCTYGFAEKRDLQAVLDQLGVTKVMLIGHSLGAAVALQAAAVEPRVTAVVAASTFSDLRTIASERVAMIPARFLGPAFARAERDGQFVLDEVSPVRAAATILVPVLLVHGADDRETAPAHSRRVYDALRGPRELIIVPGAGHVNVFQPHVWVQIERWLAQSPP